MTISTRKERGLRRACLLAACSLFVLLAACSDNKSQSDTPAATKGTSQSAVDEKGATQPQPEAAKAAPVATGAGQCSTLVTAKCVGCHNTARICEKLGKKSKSRWQRTVDRMIERGAKLGPEEAAALVTCLDKGASELQGACQ